MGHDIGQDFGVFDSDAFSKFARGFMAEPPAYTVPDVQQVVGRLETVSRQPGFEKLYRTVAEDLGGRRVTPADAAGTLLADVVRFVEGEDLFVKSIAHTLIISWLSALFGDDTAFEAAAIKVYATVVVGTTAIGHVEHMDH